MIIHVQYSGSVSGSVNSKYNNVPGPRERELKLLPNISIGDGGGSLWELGVGHCGRWGWFIVGDGNGSLWEVGVAHCKIYDCLLLGIWWLIVSYVVAHCWRCGGSLLGIWWLITSYVVAHC